MFCSSSRELALSARIFKNSRFLLQIRHDSGKKKSSKSSKGNVQRVVDMNREMNSLYGNLIETQVQKKKRIKMETEGKIGKTVPSNVDSECVWISESSPLVKVLSKGSNKNKNKENENCDNQETEKSKRPVETSDSVILPNDSISKQVTLLPNEIVNKIMQFPIGEKNKSIEDKWTNDSKVLRYSPMEEKSCLNYPSVTRVLSATMSEESKAVLERWKMNMIQKLGPDGFEIYQRELLNDGKLLHLAISNKLQQIANEIPNKIQASFSSLQNVLSDINEVRAIESHVIHPKLMYRGIVDCVAVYRGELCAIDWKKSDKIKETIGATYDAPIQLASYIGALNASMRYPFQIKKGLIAVAYTNGSPAKAFEIGQDLLQLYWKLWLQRLQEYHKTPNAS